MYSSGQLNNGVVQRGADHTALCVPPQLTQIYLLLALWSSVSVEVCFEGIESRVLRVHFSQLLFYISFYTFFSFALSFCFKAFDPLYRLLSTNSVNQSGHRLQDVNVPPLNAKLASFSMLQAEVVLLTAFSGKLANQC